MAAEQYTNLAATTLNGAITDVATSLVVTSATNFPSGGDFKIIIDSEIIKVTGVSGTTFTIVRAQESTTGVAHSNLAPLTHVVTAASIVRIINQNVCGAAVIGSRPSAGDAGRLFIPTSGLTLQRDTGTIWTPYGPLHAFTQGFAVADYTAVNPTGGTTAVIADQGGIIALSKPPQNSVNVTMYVKTAPSTPYTIVIAFNAALIAGSNTPRCGLCFRASGDGNKLKGLSLNHVNVTTISVERYSALTTLTTQGHTGVNLNSQPIWWFRISDNGTDCKYWFSIDSISWILFHTEVRTAHITPDQVGFFLDSAGVTTTTVSSFMNLLSWQETSDNV